MNTKKSNSLFVPDLVFFCINIYIFVKTKKEVNNLSFAFYVFQDFSRVL